MNGASSFRVTFHVHHPRMPADEIERIIGMPIRYSQSVGTARKTKKGTPLEGVYESTNISFALHETPLSFDGNAIESIIADKFVSVDGNFLRKIHESGGYCHFLIGVFSDGNVSFDLGADTIQQLSALKVGIRFDFYGGEGP